MLSSLSHKFPLNSLNLITIHVYIRVKKIIKLFHEYISNSLFTSEHIWNIIFTVESTHWCNINYNLNK
jgi:hypothetical protein